MNLIQFEGGKYTFHIREREKLLLFEMLNLYPLIEKPYQPLSKTADPATIKTDQELLEEALTTHQAANKKALDAMLGSPERFEKQEQGYRFTLDAAQINWLLQVLNDIRVGSWRRLGSPEENQGPAVEINDENYTYALALEVSGMFQSVLLRALADPI